MNIWLFLTPIAMGCISGFIYGQMWAERKKKPSMQPFAITLNGYCFALTAYKSYRQGGWLRYEDDRGILIAAFPESSLINPAKTEC